MSAALLAEWVKSRRSLTPLIVTIAVTVGPALLGGGMLAAAGRGNAVVDAQLVAYTTGSAWSDLGTLAGVITAAGGLLGAGVLLSWSFGREFADGAIPRLFASPTPRTRVAAAKLALFAVWSVLVAVTMTSSTLVVGMVLGYGGPEAAGVAALLKLATVSVLSSLLAMPCAWVATVGGGVLAPVGTAVGIIVVSQLSVLTGAGAWFPFAAPGAWAGLSAGVDAVPVSAAQLVMVLPVAVLFAWLTVRAWRRLSL